MNFLQLTAVLFFSAISVASNSQNVRSIDTISKQTFTYASKDSALQLDYYSKTSLITTRSPTILFVFGGAFVGGHRDDTIYRRYFDTLVNNGYKVVSISYRLGLKGVTNVSPLHTAPLRRAITMAVEDLYDATNWVIVHSESLGMDTSAIILSGSSAGAVTVLEADFMKSNRKKEAAVLPAGFNYGAVISFSGAILSYDGRLKYKTPPAPALLFHGTADRIVTYNKVRFFNKGLYGSSYIARVYQRSGLPYYIFRVKDMGHEISVIPMYTQLPVVLDFVQQYVINKKRRQVDVTFKDPDEKPLLTISAKQLFQKLAK